MPYIGALRDDDRGAVGHHHGHKVFVDFLLEKFHHVWSDPKPEGETPFGGSLQFVCGEKVVAGLEDFKEHKADLGNCYAEYTPYALYVVWLADVGHLMTPVAVEFRM